MGFAPTPGFGGLQNLETNTNDIENNDRGNYMLLILLYTLQGIPIGLSSTIPFLISSMFTSTAAAAAAANLPLPAASTSSQLYSTQALFALATWPFSLKLLWAPLVDAIYHPVFGRRKSWIIPCQLIAGLLLISTAKACADMLDPSSSSVVPLDATFLTAIFFAIFFMLSTQDIALDAWALTMLSKKNRGLGPICNSIGQNIGVFISYTGFLTFSDPKLSDKYWRPLLRMAGASAVDGGSGGTEQGVIGLESFLRGSGMLMIVVTILVGLFKHENRASVEPSSIAVNVKLAQLPPPPRAVEVVDDDSDDDAELDAAVLGIGATYSRLYSLLKLPAVKSLILVLLTYRLPFALSDNVKLLKALEYGLPKSSIAILSPFIILPLGILTPIVSSKIWSGRPLDQFLFGFKLRVFLLPILDLVALHLIKNGDGGDFYLMTSFLVLSTAVQSLASSLQTNGQMTFFASRVDPNIGGSYMTLLNTFANLGGTWPASPSLWLLGKIGSNSKILSAFGLKDIGDGYLMLQVCLTVIGVAWLYVWEDKVRILGKLGGEEWRTAEIGAIDDDDDLEGLVKKREKAKGVVGGMKRRLWGVAGGGQKTE
jgi:PAT family acetyl-CoA transporter-like MFS transporter 1